MRNLLLFILLFFFPLPTWVEASSARVVIIMSEKNNIYEKIADTCNEELTRLFPSGTIQIFNMTDYKNPQALRKTVLDFYPDVNLAIGRNAAMLCNSMTIFPVVYTMVINPVEAELLDENGHKRLNGTGINTLVSAKSQFEELRKNMPDARIIGTLCSEKSAPFVKKAEVEAKKLGLSIETLRVNSPDQVSQQFRALSKKKIDVFWLVFDVIVISEFTLGYLMDSCEARQISFLSFNPNHLKMGASIAVYLDYAGLGKQASEIITRILRGEDASSIPIADGRYTKTQLNEKTLFQRRNQ
jgi:ABC-type uncharacterized transport system substrate-binding protein